MSKISILKQHALYVFLILFFSIVYSSNFLDSFNTSYRGFQFDSEDLVIGKVTSDFYKLKNENIQSGWYGLESFSDQTISSNPVYAINLYKNPDGVYKNLVLIPYVSSIGLQGHFFSIINKYFYFKNFLKYFRYFNCLVLSIVLVSILYFIRQRYSTLMAGIWGIVFLFSPWIVNFAPNLYWVEFTWFLPMLIGLLLINNYNKYWLFLFAFLSIAIKSACGYEYLSTILISMVLFPLADFFSSLFHHHRKEALIKLKNILYLSISGLLGFIVVFILHSYFRGNGSIIVGIQNIYHEDILRRTLLGTLNNTDLPEIYTLSLQATVSSVMSKYFNFSSNPLNASIVMGLDGRWFKFINVLALFFIFMPFFVRNFKKYNIEIIILFFFSLSASLSWFALGKAHSYIHTHMNYVLWYFGYIQMCFFIIVNSTLECLKIHLKERNSGM